ncbi:Similar to Zinc finger protein Xfin (Xenopus laevis) [Cotesia congregata]|uniref:Similar to Zinc finger protein Xfin (Xenopus laevis) n=1 Tax=Cotesia congregata TaxID=51543 RepID=A0A8J2HHG4_COTCN|nr:Similar to Zinc finger protein Xfin (Xenopus laevis) [Cotesia congregata]
MGPSQEISFGFRPKKEIFSCPKCLRGFSRKSNRNRHFKYECGHEPRFKYPLEPDESSEVSSRPSGKKFVATCPNCQKGYQRAASLRRHLKYECGQAPKFKCPYCDLRTKQASPIYTHTAWSAVFEDTKPFPNPNAEAEREISLFTCKSCFKSYHYYQSLKRHLKFECGMKPGFKCPYYSWLNFEEFPGMKSEDKEVTEMGANNGTGMEIPVADFTTYEQLQPQRGRKRSLYKNHVCPKCYRSYKRGSHLNRHMRFECGQGPRFRCPYCDFLSKQSPNIYKHIRKNSWDQQATSSVSLLVRSRRAKRTQDLLSVQYYACTTCFKKYTRNADLLRHVRNECGQSPPFKCPHCSPWNQQATSTVALGQSKPVRRKQDHLKVKLHGCPRCFRKYKRNADLRRHMFNECGQSPRFKYKIIPLEQEWPMIFKEEVELSVRTQERVIRPRIFRILKKQKQKLMKNKRIPDNVSCSKCHKVYKYSRNLQRHLKFECGLNPRFKCPYCNYCSKQYTPIYSHIRRRHLGQEVRTRFADPAYSGLEKMRIFKRDKLMKSYYCPNCGKSYSRKWLLKRHVSFECNKEPRFKCPYCDYKAKQSPNVYPHVRKMHPGFNVFFVCAWWSVDEVMLAESRVIKSQRDLCSVIIKEEVEVAELQFPNPLTLRNRGETLMQQLKTHTCPRCFKSYMHAWHLKRHIRFECGQEPKVQCPYCMVKMKQRGHVYRHIRRCHRGQNVYVIDLN